MSREGAADREMAVGSEAPGGAHGAAHALERILVTLDGSPLARTAVPFAAHLARAAGAQVLLLRVLPGLPPLFRGNPRAVRLAEAHRQQAQAQAAAELDALAQTLAPLGLRVRPQVRTGDPGPVIVEVAQRARVDLVVLATHGRAGGERLLLGSVAEHVLQTAAVPLLLIPSTSLPPWETPTRQPRTLLVPLDGSPRAEAILPPAQTLAQLLPARLHLLQVVEPSAWRARRAEATHYLAHLAAQLRAPAPGRRPAPGKGAGLGVETEVREGAPVVAIADAAAELPADLIAMATHGHRGFALHSMGSVTAATLLQTRVPLLLVRPPALVPLAAAPELEAAPRVPARHHVTLEHHPIPTQACEVCGARPAAHAVLVWLTDRGGHLAALAPVEAHYFCPAHRPDADRTYLALDHQYQADEFPV